MNPFNALTFSAGGRITSLARYFSLSCPAMHTY